VAELAERRVDRVPASGSCVRCGRALGLASAEVGGLWYGNASCATAAECPLDERDPDVPEAVLYPRPRRYMRRRKPRELRGGDSD
jgi:hypothetical protein